MRGVEVGEVRGSERSEGRGIKKREVVKGIIRDREGK